jgi:hypothetical protein
MDVMTTKGNWDIAPGRSQVILGSEINSPAENHVLQLIVTSGSVTVSGQASRKDSDGKLGVDNLAPFDINEKSSAIVTGYRISLLASKDTKFNSVGTYELIS